MDAVLRTVTYCVWECLNKDRNYAGVIGFGDRKSLILRVFVQIHSNGNLAFF
ncbi:hypothetical protein NIES2104_14800 [Leptolyngbya sp. NIES-2104]|nr:hypothetical protein NIES2104_14800 [Leptolyngbya sp. NIES-2104]